MCVRKTADTGGTPTSMQASVPFQTTSGSTGSAAKRKLKALRSRGTGSTKKQPAGEAVSGSAVTAATSGSSGSSALKKQQHQHHAVHGHGHQTASEKTTGSCSTVDVDCTVKVRDDAEGHLIYRKGDVVDSRCKFVRAGYSTRELICSSSVCSMERD